MNPVIKVVAFVRPSALGHALSLPLEKGFGAVVLSIAGGD